MRASRVSFDHFHNTVVPAGTLVSIDHITYYDIISLHGFELSNQIDCNNLVGPIGLHGIFWPGIKFGGRIALQFYQHFLVLQLGGLNFFTHLICNKKIIKIIIIIIIK